MVLFLGASGLYPLIFAAVPVLIIFITLLNVRYLAFTHTNLKITRDNYCVVRRGITWRSVFQIMFVPSHFNDLESERFVEASPKERYYVRHAALHAEVRSLIPFQYLTCSDVDCETSN